MTLHRMLRGLQYLFNYALLEYPRGLDFSMRNKSLNISLFGSHGYALTSKPALKNMFSYIPYAGKAFLDIGSGKGGPVVYARQLGCGRSAGIEYEQRLHDIATENIKILGLTDFCDSFCADARTFPDYAVFEIYFMFNPFDNNIYAEVIDILVKQNSLIKGTEPKYLICYGGANMEAVMKHDCFKPIVQGVCPYRKNSFRIFEMVPRT